MKTSTISRMPRLSTRQRGMTLVEWLVSITIGLFLLAGLAVLFQHQSNSNYELEKAGRQIENGRYAMQLLRDDIELAGYYGEYAGAGTPPGALPDPCATASADLTAAQPLPLQGYDAPSSLPCGISSANYKAGTDILVVRRADVDVVTGALTPGQVYLQSGLVPPLKQSISFVIGAATGPAVDTTLFNLQKKDGSIASLRKYLVHVYYVSPCSVPANGSTCSSANTDDGGVSVPTLKRMDLSVSGGAPQFTSVPLVEGIENMQIDYGVDTTNDGSPDAFTTSPATVSDWSNVMALRVHLLARNNERTGGYTDTKTYSLGLAGSTAATNDAFKRHVFSQLIRVVNPSSRRDQ